MFGVVVVVVVVFNLIFTLSLFFSFLIIKKKTVHGHGPYESGPYGPGPKWVSIVVGNLGEQ